MSWTRNLSAEERSLSSYAGCLLNAQVLTKITLWKIWKEVRNFLERISAEVGIPDADVSWVYEISRLRFYALIIS